MSGVSIEINSEINELFSKTEVTQKFKNNSGSTLELKINVYKKIGILFDSFQAKIGDSIEVKSNIIKKEKAQEKYTDSIASGNAAIFVQEDPKDENRYIINMGNIPNNEEVIFKSKFIHFTEYSKRFEFEFFRNLPIFEIENKTFHNKTLSGTINIKVKHRILNIEKIILMEDLKIREEKYLDKEYKNYLIKYVIDDEPDDTEDDSDSDYIPSSKIYFDLDIKYPIIYLQESSIDPNEKNYCIKYKYNDEISSNNNDMENYPAIFIFLIDQSASMEGNRIYLVSQALKLFLQSLPEGSYYQLIGFGTTYVKYDEQPKKYIKENIIKSMEIIEKLSANLGSTDIYSPLENIYSSYKIYDEIKLPKNIFY